MPINILLTNLSGDDLFGETCFFNFPSPSSILPSSPLMTAPPLDDSYEHHSKSPSRREDLQKGSKRLSFSRALGTKGQGGGGNPHEFRPTQNSVFEM